MQITVRAPASTSNLGPGFDIFGLALSLYSVFTFERSEALQISGCPEAFQNEDNLVLQGFPRQSLCEGRALPNLRSL